MIFVLWMLSFKPTFSLSSFTFIKRLFSSCLLSAIRVVSSAYLRLLIFLPAILIPAYASSILAFPMMYSAYKLNKQGDNIQPWCTPFPVLKLSIVPCPVLNCFLTCIQVSQEAAKMVFPSLSESSTVCCDPHKGFRVVNEAAVDIFLEFPCFFYDPADLLTVEVLPKLVLSNPAAASSIKFMEYSKPFVVISVIFTRNGFCLTKPLCSSVKHLLIH